MKENSFKLLKELLQLQVAGGFEMFDYSIELATDVYCEIAKRDKERFNKDLRDIQVFCWKDGYKDSQEFRARQKIYSHMLDMLEKGEIEE